MNFRIAELIETDKFQYVRIHKNASMSVLDCIKENYKDKFYYTYKLSNEKPRFCIIQDPYKRFISGLRYDLFRQSVDIKDIDLKQLLSFNETHFRNNMLGNLNHCISQILYLFNYQITHYIDIDDLNIFLKMHFNKTKTLNVLPPKEKNKNIEKYLDKEDILKYLHLDYHIYNQIKNSPFLWKWQHGKIF